MTIKKILFFLMLIFLLTACTQTQSEFFNSSPINVVQKKIQQIQKTVEDNGEKVEQVTNSQSGISQQAKQGEHDNLRAGVEATSTAIKLEKQNQELDLENKYYQVVKVVDGDTIDVNIDGKTERIRIIGLNTPETVDPRKPVECFGKEAANKAGDLLAGKEVRLEGDVTQGERDKYGRLLRYVYLIDETDFSLKMIKDGYGYEYTYDLPYNNQQLYNEAEAYARENKIGLWAPDVCAENEKDSELSMSAPDSNIVPIAPLTDSAKLTITNIFYDGVEGNQEPDEYVEIKNIGESANIKGYTLSDESGKIYTFKDFNLATDQSVKIFTGCGDDASNSLYWCFTNSAIWNNSGDTATLKDSSGKEIESYNYKK